MPQEPRISLSSLPDSPWWQIVLDHLEEKWSEQLEVMLRNNSLRKHLEGVVGGVVRQEAKLQAQGQDPNDPGVVEVLNKLALQENPEYDPDNPKELSPAGRKLLEEFERKVNEEPSPREPMPAKSSRPPPMSFSTPSAAPSQIRSQIPRSSGLPPK